MTDGEIGGGAGGPGADPWHQPLPPETPVPDGTPPPVPDTADPPVKAETGPEWWRVPPPQDPPAPENPPAPGEDPAFKDAPAWGEQEAGPGPADDDAWPVAVHGSAGLEAAHEIAVTIGEAVVSHLPNVPAAAEQRGLDLRWLHLKVNVPAVLVALGVTWGGSSFSDAVAHTAATDGPLGLLGWVLLPALAIGFLMVAPIGGVFGRVVVDVIRNVLYGVGALVSRAWSTAYTGYLLRLAAAIVGWAVVFAVVRVIGRAVIRWLTGV
ncbi:hypothetical protein [Streptomyces sp. NPDC023838]|uniref:hypothetical protein n=1 Tax=Streptomyces sp. NPDC023838 TaxID=3154325 RepID=UPI003410BEDF